MQIQRKWWMMLGLWAMWMTWATAGIATAQSPVRVIAVQPKIDLVNADTYARYRSHLLGLVEAQVRPRLATDRPNLVVFPEDVGLPAAFIGTRAVAARTQTNVLGAYASLFTGNPPPYGFPLFYYNSVLPSLPPERLPALALTDTLWRAFYETFRDIARQTSAWVVASTNVSGQIELSTDQTDVFFLNDPDLPLGPVYVARDPNVYNTAFVFSPQGNIVAAARKPYITPIEEDLLRFSYGPLRALAPIDLGFIRIGVITSKDAWMPDVLDRLAILGAETLVQPEAFGGWGIFDNPAHPEDWLPDNFLQSGWAAVQKYSTFRWDVIPHITGNLFDLPFDGQSAILGDAVPSQTQWGYVGQEPLGGFLTVAPWVVPDPGIANPALSLQTRRDLLRTAGFSLLPGFPNANGYVETAIHADIAPIAPFPVQPNGEPGVFGASKVLAPSPSGEQTYASVSSLGGEDGKGVKLVAVAWQDTRDGLPQVYAAFSRNGGRTFSPAKRVSPSTNPQRTPAIVVTPSSLTVAWQEERGGERRILVAETQSLNLNFGPPSALPTASPADEWKPALTWGWGRLAGRQWPRVYLAFVQTTNGNERVQVARRLAGKREWTITPADPMPSFYPAPNVRNNQWAPAIAAREGEIAVAWVDLRNYGWEVMLSRSTDGGQSFGMPVRVDDAPDDWERIHSDPSLAFVPEGMLVVGWSDVRQRLAPAKARAARGSMSFGVSKVLASAASPDASSWRPQLVYMGTSGVAAVWQDFRTSGNNIYLSFSDDAGLTYGQEQRVDDGGEGPSYQFAPQVAAVTLEELLVLWEDTRSGRRQIRYVIGSRRR